MRILFDLQSCQTESRLRGIGRYSLALMHSLLAQAKEHEVWILLNRQLPAVEELRFLFKDLVPQDQIFVFDVPAKCSWGSTDNMWRLPVAELIREQVIRRIDPDLIHISSLFEGLYSEDAVTSISRLDTQILTAVTLYDLIPLISPEKYLPEQQHRSGYMEKVDFLKHADLLLSISAYSRQEAIDNLGISADRIVNISSAQHNQFTPLGDEGVQKARQCIERFGINKPYILYNGAFDERKNIDSLIEAFALLPANLRKQYQLVLSGKVFAQHQAKLERLAKKLDVLSQLVFTNHVSDSDLLSLFQLATVFVFPSLHEGFGLPALEAMACGIPTIGSNLTSIPEVIGRQDALFDPKDVQSIASKLNEVLSNEDFRQELAAYGLKKSQEFGWDQSARIALKAFEDLYAARKKIHPSSTNSSWAEQQAQFDLEYQELIAQIAAVPASENSPTQKDLVATAACIAANQSRLELIARARVLPKELHWRVEGPFDSTYSLALLNRETARALRDLGHTVSLHSTEGPGDFLPDTKFLEANLDLQALYNNSLQFSDVEADISSRNLYPPRVADMSARMNMLHHYAWEESGFPAAWVDDFNQYLQGMTCLSSHVQKIMVDNGVNIPMAVSGCGVDHWERVLADPTYRIHAKSFRFLHVSSCFPRKGVDVLLAAYGKAFSNTDDVTLIIKTFANPHNQVKEWLALAKQANPQFPDVQIIEGDLTDAQLKALYEQCQALVAPSYAEGFGLPLAEAMLSNLSVITTGWGGQLDFCNTQTAHLIDFNFELADTHFQLFDSVWAKPKVDHLALLMSQVYQEPLEARLERAAAARKLLLEQFTWRAVAQRLVDAARHFSQIKKRNAPKIGWVSTWNTQCGIASYSEALLQELSSDAVIFAPTLNYRVPSSQADGRYQVIRCWEAGDQGKPLVPLAQALQDHPVDVLVIQFQYSFFEVEELGRFLDEQIGAGRKIILMMHSTTDPIEVLPHQRLHKIAHILKRCDRILVHAPGDLNRLKDLGLVSNVALFPHGIPEAPRQSKAADTVPSKETEQNRVIQIASYGFFLPHKGLLELIEAIAILRQQGINACLHMVNAAYPASVSTDLITLAKRKISELGLKPYVTITSEFLEDSESLRLLSKADLLVFPYQVTGESSSAAVRTGLASGTPIAVTPLSIFDDVRPAATVLPGITPQEIAQGVADFFEKIGADPAAEAARQAQALRWINDHRYRHIGPRLYRMIQALSA